MLTELHIENLGVIERLELTLSAGLTALTGETGAGKTMLVEAIELLVGGRANNAMVRQGAAEARVDGRFVAADGTETILSRVIPAEGRSRAYVNGRLATATLLAESAANSVDLHGQHAHQDLLSISAQRAALDEYGKVDLDPLRSVRGRLAEIDAASATLGGDARARAREIDLLRHQIAELDAANVVEAREDLLLDAEESLLADAVAHREAGVTAYALLADDDGARDFLAQALLSLDGRRPFTSVSEGLRGLLAEVDDLIAEVRDISESIDESPDRLAELRERRQLMNDLQRKYGDGLSAVMAFHAEAEDRLRQLESFDERSAVLDAQRQSFLAEERAVAEAVGRARRAAAPKLASAVQKRLRTLAMPNAAVAVEVDGDNPGDRVQFLFAANPGSPLLPLTRVASGGELARTMLALRLVLSAASGIRAKETLVFDEVDAGIGGEAAQSIGDALAALGRHHQVLVVTHLAQVAAAADTHVSVSKKIENGATFATAHNLPADERVDEIARMLSGSSTQLAREHARELLAESPL
ncbi:DNA repair protein RecN [uncultured Ilumatobacter sp.]|uniref:DNA repair protein RecN n=1 Tax=uncultured Ilumatobacter sp. TaxID=879968 RepID=UPI00374F6767